MSSISIGMECSESLSVLGSGEFDELDNEQDEFGDSKSDLVEQMITSLIRRCSQEVEDKVIGVAVDDLKIFIRLHSNTIKMRDQLVKVLEKTLTVYIVKYGLPFTKEYVLVTGINKFEDFAVQGERKYVEQPTLPPLAAEDVVLIEEQVEKNCRWNVLKNNSGCLEKEKRITTKYKVGQIVGARDSERRWWMSRILFVFEDPKYPYPWYYVHFEGWSDIQNEWISSPYRIKCFNPRRDFLKR